MIASQTSEKGSLFLFEVGPPFCFEGEAEDDGGLLVTSRYTLCFAASPEASWISADKDTGQPLAPGRGLLFLAPG